MLVLVVVLVVVLVDVLVTGVLLEALEYDELPPVPKEPIMPPIMLLIIPFIMLPMPMEESMLFIMLFKEDPIPVFEEKLLPEDCVLGDVVVMVVVVVVEDWLALNPLTMFRI